MASFPLEKLKERLNALQRAKDSARALHYLFFDLHLPDEVMQMHKVIHDLDIRIEQIQMLIDKHTRNSED